MPVFDVLRGRVLPSQIYTPGSGATYEDETFPSPGIRLDSAATRYSFDTTNLGVQFNVDSRYPEEQISGVVQMKHKKQLETPICLHFHWIQNQAAIPNYLCEYRVWSNGGTAPGAWTRTTTLNHVFSYVSGSLPQVSEFPDIPTTGLGLSDFLEFKFWRDTANTSTAFAGADPVASAVLIKAWDCHYNVDSLGSITEFQKRY